MGFISMSPEMAMVHLAVTGGCLLFGVSLELYRAYKRMQSKSKK